MLAELAAKTCGIEHRAGTDDTLLRKSGHLQCRIGQDIDRVCDDEENPVKAALCDLGDDRAEDADVLVDQVQSRFAGLLCGTCGHDDDTGVLHIVIGAGIDLHRACERNTVGDVQCFALCLLGDGIDEDHLIEQTALHECEGGRGSDKSAAYDTNFSCIHLYVSPFHQESVLNSSFCFSLFLSLEHHEYTRGGRDLYVENSTNGKAMKTFPVLHLLSKSP